MTETKDVTILFYTANRVKPSLMQMVISTLKEAAGTLPIISVSQKVMDFGENICVGDIGWNTWNLYYQMLMGAKAAQTRYVATAEDDVLYSYEHYHEERPDDDVLLYDMNRWSIFTWKEPVFSYKTDRLVAHQLICSRILLISILEERFQKYPSPDTIPIKFFGEPGRYSTALGVSERKIRTFWSSKPSIVFNHEKSLQYATNGTRKASGSFSSNWLYGWGMADSIMQRYNGHNDSLFN